jgi:hypothetical protein
LTLTRSMAVKEKELAAMTIQLHQQQLSFPQNQFQAGSNSYVFNNCNFNKVPFAGPQAQYHTVPLVANPHAADESSHLDPRLTEVSTKVRLRHPMKFAKLNPVKCMLARMSDDGTHLSVRKRRSRVCTGRGGSIVLIRMCRSGGLVGGRRGRCLLALRSQDEIKKISDVRLIGLKCLLSS